MPEKIEYKRLTKKDLGNKGGGLNSYGRGKGGRIEGKTWEKKRVKLGVGKVLREKKNVVEGKELTVGPSDSSDKQGNSKKGWRWMNVKASGGGTPTPWEGEK